MKKISVLMAVYNTELNLVLRAINSVLNQDFQDFELIVIDDGSTNDRQHSLRNFCKGSGNKISYHFHQHCGQSESINKGVLFSKGEYITILDADDEYKTNHLSACLEEMKNADLIASTSETVVGKEEDYFVPDKNDQTKLIHVDECILFATLFGKREVFSSLCFTDMFAADADFYQRASMQYHVKKVDLKTYIYYRNNPNSLCSEMKRKNITWATPNGLN